VNADRLIPVLCVAVAAALIAVGVRFPAVAPLLWWLAADLVVVAVAYVAAAPRLLGGKRADGSFDPVGATLMLPYLLLMGAWWHLLRLFRRERPYDRLTDTITIGRRLLPREYPGGFAHVIDLTAELASTRPYAGGRTYAAFPILDSSGLCVADMLRLVQAAGRQRDVYIHCAAGHGRAGMVAACVLLSAGTATGAEDAMRRVREVRPGAVLTAAQRRAVAAFARHVAEAGSTWIRSS
jgi:hypothetical protein